MILGFSHLTHTTATAETVVAGWRARGWDLAWADADVPSAEAKWPLMAAKEIGRAHV